MLACSHGLGIFLYKQTRIPEKTAKFIVPIMLVILVGLACYSMTQPGAVEGLKYSFGFEFSELLNANIWIQAITQDFWSLGSGTMLCVTLSKYSAKKEDIVVNTNVQGFGDISFAMLGTLVVLPCIFTFAGSTEEALELAQSGNNGVTFVGLTNLFETLPMGRVIGTLFFLSLAFCSLYIDYRCNDSIRRSLHRHGMES